MSFTVAFSLESGRQSYSPAKHCLHSSAVVLSMSHRGFETLCRVLARPAGNQQYIRRRAPVADRSGSPFRLEFSVQLLYGAAYTCFYRWLLNFSFGTVFFPATTLTMPAFTSTIHHHPCRPAGGMRVNVTREVYRPVIWLGRFQFSPRISAP